MATKAKPAGAKATSGKKKKKKGGGDGKVRPLAIVAAAEATPTLGVHGKGGKQGWEPGEVRNNQEVGGDGDGTPMDDFVNSQLKDGQTQQQWLSGAVKNMQAKGVNVPDLSNSADAQGWVDGIYASHGSNSKAASDEIFADWKAAGAKFDPSEQYRTSLYEYKGEKKKGRIWDKSQHSWVDVEVPVLHYVNAKTFPYIVRNDAPAGSVFEATYKDSKGVLHTAPVMVADHGTNHAEMSPGALHDLHIPGTVNSVDAKVSLKYLGQGDLSHLPTRESLQKDYERLKAELGNKQSNAQSQGGAFFLSDVPDHGVMAGGNHLLIAVAHPACQHSGGVPVTTGSPTIFVGQEQAPASGEGDETADGYIIKDKTGDQTVFMA